MPGGRKKNNKAPKLQIEETKTIENDDSNVKRLNKNSSIENTNNVDDEEGKSIIES